ncbi:MAG: ATP-binding cassette domain-containing protein [Bdellovibrio sp.]|nr:MAG: ATP-binding cassette domain-containing protein [Bdellovibrio sp.]
MKELTRHDVIALQNVTIELEGHLILKDISLTVREQETLVMIGPSGEGKTVLLKTMAGLYQASKGDVLIEGRSWKDLSEEERRAQCRRIGMLFQKSALFDSLTAEENVMFPMQEHTQMSFKQMLEKAHRLLNAVGLEGAYKKFPYELSGGMQRRLGIARALALDPPILFYDDPTAGLDPVISERIVQLIIQLKEQFNSTVVAVTNDLVSAFDLADRLVMLANKTLIETGTVAETKKSSDPHVQQFLRGDLNGPLKPLSF